MSDDQTFRLEEYKSLRKEVELYLAESRSQERYTVIAAGLIWAWLIVNQLKHPLLWSIPIIVTGASAIRMAAVNIHFVNLQKYLIILEDKFGVNGWEQQKRGWTLGAANVILSCALLVLSIVAALMSDRLLAAKACK